MSELTPQQEVEALRRLTQEQGMSNLEALAQVRAEEAARRMAEKFNQQDGRTKR